MSDLNWPFGRNYSELCCLFSETPQPAGGTPRDVRIDLHSMRTQILQDVRICFTSVIPHNAGISPEASPVYQLALQVCIMSIPS